ncbi:MAG: hypothetical protein VXZ72_00085 [Chlamydiota bacterium]|nr:hypothetical protein [Chlamydiota bacterium]
MNSLDHFLLKTASREEKVAFDQTLRNFGVDVVGGAGRVLRNFDTNPMVSSAVLGAGVGGVHGAYTAQPGESRLKKGLRNALAGGVAGGATGGLMAGAVRNIGRYGDEIAEGAKKIRGTGALQDAKAGDLRKLMRETVLNPDSARGGKKLKSLRDALDRAEAAAALDATAANAKAVKDARIALNQDGGGLGTRFNPLKATGMVAGAGLAGSMANNYREKNSSLRIRSAIDKQANFAQLAAKAVGATATGAGKAIQVGAANPALAGAAIGAGTGALAAGEGNRLKGMLGGAALGAAGGAAAGKFAPGTMTKIKDVGQNLSRAGKDTTALTGIYQKGDSFSGMMSGKFKNVMDPFKTATS